MAAAQKHEREAVRAVESLHPRLRADVEKRGGVANTHKWLVATLDDLVVRVCCASSPTSPDRWRKQLVSNVRRKFRDQGVQL